jgi:hypothetical protein
VITSKRFVAKGLGLLSGLKQNPEGRRFKDDREVETAVTRWMMTEGTDWYQQGIAKVIA